MHLKNCRIIVRDEGLRDVGRGPGAGVLAAD